MNRSNRNGGRTEETACSYSLLPYFWFFLREEVGLVVLIIVFHVLMELVSRCLF